MTRSRRTVVGAAVGSLFVLLAHPATRPGLITPFRPYPKDGLDGLLVRPSLPPPSDLKSAAAFLVVGAERVLAGPALKPNERATLLALAQRGRQNDPDNAFWSQAEFVFRDGAGPSATSAWRAGGAARLYNDYQNTPLVQDRDRVAGWVGDVQAWIFSAIRGRRSPAMAQASALVVRRMMRRSPDLNVRFWTIQNGALLRDGGRSLEIGRYGMEMIERAPLPPDLAAVSTPKRVWVAKTELTARLRRAGRAADAAYCDRQFRINDSYQALRDLDKPTDRFRALSISAAMVASAPGGLLIAALAGLAVWIFGLRVENVAEQREKFRGPGLTACSLTLLTVGAALGYPVAALSAAACALVPAIGTDRPRPYTGQLLGPLYEFTVGSLCLLLVVGVTLIAIARSLPGQILSSQGDLGAWLGDWHRLGAILLLVLGASALIGPGWGVVRRFATPRIAGETYLRLGRGVTMVGIGLAIVASPISLILDRWIGDHLAKIALNEQVYYNPSDLRTP